MNEDDNCEAKARHVGGVKSTRTARAVKSVARRELRLDLALFFVTLLSLVAAAAWLAAAVCTLVSERVPPALAALLISCCERG